MTPQEAGLEIERGMHFTKLSQWLNLNTDNGEPLIYALVECIQDRLDKSDLTEIDKGAILNDLFETLRENNREELAFYREFKRAGLDALTATKH